MPRWIRITSGCTAFLMLWTTLLSGFSYAQKDNEEEAGQVVRTIVGRDSDGWAVVDIRTVTGL